MSDIILPLILAYSVIILSILFVIDLKTRLLPNKYVLQFFFLGMAFHIVTGFHYTTPLNMVIAALLSSGILLLIRTIGNRIYKTDTLGLGDVKLMGAAGIWLGTNFIFLAISLGAIMGIFHGIAYVIHTKITTGENINFAKLSIPAGPGFIIGIIIIAIAKFHNLPIILN